MGLSNQIQIKFSQQLQVLCDSDSDKNEINQDHSCACDALCRQTNYGGCARPALYQLYQPSPSHTQTYPGFRNLSLTWRKCGHLRVNITFDQDDGLVHLRGSLYSALH